MEKSTNGKLEEEEVIVHGVEEFKPDGIIHVEETPGDGHDSSSSSSSSSSDEESPVLPVDEKMEFDSVEPPLVPPSEEFIPDGELVVENMDVSDDVTELDTKEIKEQTLPSLDGDNGFVSAVVSEETLEKFLSGSNGNIGESSDVVKLASVENVETKLQLDDENIENSSKVADLESKENVEKPADVPSVDTDKVGERSVEAEIPGSQINQPIISLAPRARHMTSWRNCCGLFDFLRRSDR